MSSRFLQDILASDELDIKQPVCDLTALFKNIRVLSSTTSSSTIQVLATLTNKAKTYQAIKEYVDHTGKDNIFIKIGFDQDNDNSVDIERMMYRYLRKLLFYNRTPNIMRYVAAFKCNNFLDFLKSNRGKTHKRYYDDMIQRVDELVIREGDLDGDKATITLIELGDGKPFHNILKDGNLTEEEFKSIMFQTFYTLREFHLNKVRHNDIHLGNIWVNIYSTPQRLIYFVDDNMYVILETRYVVKLFDFDRSAFTIGPYNEVLKNIFCPKYGMCSNENERFDLLIVINQLYMEWASKYTYINDFVFKVINNPDYLEDACCVFPGRFCDLKLDPATNEVRCSPNAIIEANGIYNIEQLCNLTDYFDPYLHFINTDGFDPNDIPIKKTARHNEIPLYIFETDMYVSSACIRTAIQMANRLLALR